VITEFGNDRSFAHPSRLNSSRNARSSSAINAEVGFDDLGGLDWPVCQENKECEPKDVTKEYRKSYHGEERNRNASARQASNGSTAEELSLT